METIPSEMLRGHVDTIILLSLLDCDKHTSQIKEEIESRVDGHFELKQGTFYSCLQRVSSQGFVTEYRSTSNDGKRRKFYQLTEKGKSYIEDNKDKWLFSRNIINSLIQVPLDTTQIGSVYDERNAQNQQTNNEPQIETETTQSQNETADIKTEEAQKQAEIIENQANEIMQLNEKLDSIQTKLEQIVENNNQATSPQENDSLTEIEKYLSGQEMEQESDSFSDDVSDDYTSKSTPIFDYLDQLVKAEEENKNLNNDQQINLSEIEETEKIPEKTPDFDSFYVVEQNKQHVDPVPVQTVEPPLIVQALSAQQQQNDAEKERKAQQIVDDYFNGEDSITHDYKAVLSKLFPDQPVEQPSYYADPTYQTSQVPQTPSIEEVSSYFEETETPLSETGFYYDETYEKPKHKISKKQQKQLLKSKVKPESYEQIEESRQAEKFDFSEILELANAEGFKVRTSESHAKKEVGKIYVNKLLFSSAITFYLLLLIEIAVLAFTTRSVSLLSPKHYVIFGAVMAIFPIVASIMYFIEPMKKVDSIITFKSILSFIFVVVLNLILITIVYSILINIDFTSPRQLMLYVFYPLIFILNLPIYFFIKYLKLDNQKYYS